MENVIDVLSEANIHAKDRGAFVRKTYAHLAGAILAFALLEAFVLSIPATRELTAQLLGMRYGMLMVMGGFVIVGMIASYMATSARSLAAQYAGLALYVVAEAIVFAPLLLIAQVLTGDSSLILQAAGMTALLFGGLTATVIMTGKDFSFLRGFIIIASFCALGVILVGAIFGFTLGLWFSVAMILLAGASILYQTSAIVRDYDEDRYVGASLALFASVATLFWYILALLMRLRSND